MTYKTDAVLALSKSILLWEALAATGGSCKVTVYRKLGLQSDYLDCPLCELSKDYNAEAEAMGVDCAKCPMKDQWGRPGTNIARCTEAGSVYMLWTSAYLPENRKIYASELLGLLHKVADQQNTTTGES